MFNNLQQIELSLSLISSHSTSSSRNDFNYQIIWLHQPAERGPSGGKQTTKTKPYSWQSGGSRAQHKLIVSIEILFKLIRIDNQTTMQDKIEEIMFLTHSLTLFPDTPKQHTNFSHLPEMNVMKGRKKSMSTFCPLIRFRRDIPSLFPVCVHICRCAI